MSSGQRSMMDDDEEAGRARHELHLRGLGYPQVAHVIESILTEIRYLRAAEIPLTRVQHERFTTIEKLVRKLSP